MIINKYISLDLDVQLEDISENNAKITKNIDFDGSQYLHIYLIEYGKQFEYMKIGYSQLEFLPKSQEEI